MRSKYDWAQPEVLRNGPDSNGGDQRERDFASSLCADPGYGQVRFAPKSKFHET